MERSQHTHHTHTQSSRKTSQELRMLSVYCQITMIFVNIFGGGGGGGGGGGALPLLVGNIGSGSHPPQVASAAQGGTQIP